MLASKYGISSPCLSVTEINKTPLPFDFPTMEFENINMTVHGTIYGNTRLD